MANAAEGGCPYVGTRDPASSIYVRYTAGMISLGSHPVWHPLFETLAYGAGYAVFRQLRKRKADIIGNSQRWVVMAAAGVGALLGSRLLGLAEQWPVVVSAVNSGHLLALLISPGGKTIVGGLLGGWIAVEVVKKLSGIQDRTGDLFVLPLCVGIAIGRVGCLLAGVADDTYGKPTSRPWGVDFGDGVARHPVQAYEILLLLGLAVLLARSWRLKEGSRFRIFMGVYLGWRLLIDFLKPQPTILGMNAIQWACAAGLSVLAIEGVRMLMRGRACSRIEKEAEPTYMRITAKEGTS